MQNSFTYDGPKIKNEIKKQDYKKKEEFIYQLSLKKLVFLLDSLQVLLNLLMRRKRMI